MKRLVWLLLFLACITATLMISGPVMAVSSSATAVVDFIPGDPNEFSCYPTCPGDPNGPVIPPIPVTSLAQCEAYCESACHVSSCQVTTPPLSGGTPGIDH